MAKSLIVSFLFFCVEFAAAEHVLSLIGHRGGNSYEAPEHTLICMSEEYTKSVAGFEFDVRMTADGDAVLLHNGTVDRTTNGTGEVRDLSTAYVKSLDAGSWKSSVFTGEKVPLLSEALEKVKERESKAYIDLKEVTAEAVRKAVDLAQFPEENLIFLAFNGAEVAEFGTEFPNAAVYYSLWGLGYDRERTPSIVASLVSRGVKGVTLRREDFSGEYVQALHAGGLRAAVVANEVTYLSDLESYYNAQVDEVWLSNLHKNVSYFLKDKGQIIVPEKHTVALVGHRGGDSRSAPENTLVCLSEQYSQGVWGHELDVRTTADGDVVLMHDGLVDRTTNGTGETRDLSTATIRSLDAGSWKSPEFSGEGVPFLSEALQVIKERGTVAFLDMKGATASAVREAVDVVGFPEDRLAFLTFTNSQAASFIREFPDSSVYYSLWAISYNPNTTPAQLESLASLGVKGITMSMRRYSDTFVEAVHSVGLRVALVGGKVESEQDWQNFITSRVDELWLDDLTSIIENYNDGKGNLAIPVDLKINSLELDPINKRISLNWYTKPFKSYLIEESDNLRTWRPISGNAIQAKWTESEIEIPQGESSRASFYRVSEIN